MYKAADHSQSSFLDFNQPLGLRMNPNNRWIKLADLIPWDEFEKRYRHLFKSKTGNVAKPLRMALGALIIQQKYQFSDRELVEQITENPYLQYFIGLPGYQEEPPFDASTLVLFRKRISQKMLMEVNEAMLASPEKDEPDKKDDDHSDPPSGSSLDDSSDNEQHSDDAANSGTIILDATCAPVNIRYPQDVSLLNEAREKLERILWWYHKEYSIELPRRDCRAARKAYLEFAKSKRHTNQKIRKALKRQLSYVRRNLEHIDGYMADGYAPATEHVDVLITIFKLYEQQLYMFKNKVHKVEDRIVSLHQPWVRPIVRGKQKAPVEFGPKLDLSIDSNGYARIERISFDAYNESSCLQDAVEAFYQREGHYPERVLADQIYRTRQNRAFCKEHGIRLSGPKLGRPDVATIKNDRKLEYQDNTDRIEVERRFSLCKRSYGLGKIMTKLKETQLTTVALSVFVANLFRKMQQILFCLFDYLIQTDVIWQQASAG
ncbi:MAG: IS5 family transposase [Lachnospiraceae bacterium]|nr:IS5 family transposase [Lachnospiraceae bacterium]